MSDRPILFSAESVERFRALIDKRGKNDCWPWVGKKNSKGYGRFHADGRSIMAHRLSVLLDGRDVPEGLETHHVCRNRWCVNPSHLRVVSHRTNLLSGTTIAAAAAARTTCPKGHALSGTNVVVRDSKRSCRECARLRASLRYEATSTRRRRPHITREEFDEIKARVGRGQSHSTIAAAMNLSVATISRVRNAEVNHGR